jgi:hypothetical protein
MIWKIDEPQRAANGTLLDARRGGFPQDKKWFPIPIVSKLDLALEWVAPRFMRDRKYTYGKSVRARSLFLGSPALTLWEDDGPSGSQLPKIAEAGEP